MLDFYYLAEKSSFTDNYGGDWVARFVEQGLPTALLGILTVFSVLALIWGSLEIFRYVFYTIPERKKKQAVSAPATGTVLEPETVPDDIVSNDDEIVAAIIAAVTAARAEENVESPTAFRVVSFRRR